MLPKNGLLVKKKFGLNYKKKKVEYLKLDHF